MKFPLKEAKITDADYATLTPREQEVMRLLAEGLSSKEVAEKLFISPKTVENHRANIMNKLDFTAPSNRSAMPQSSEPSMSISGRNNSLILYPKLKIPSTSPHDIRDKFPVNRGFPYQI